MRSSEERKRSQSVAATAAGIVAKCKWPSPPLPPSFFYSRSWASRRQIDSGGEELTNFLPFPLAAAPLEGKERYQDYNTSRARRGGERGVIGAPKGDYRLTNSVVAGPAQLLRKFGGRKQRTALSTMTNSFAHCRSCPDNSPPRVVARFLLLLSLGRPDADADERQDGRCQCVSEEGAGERASCRRSLGNITHPPRGQTDNDTVPPSLPLSLLVGST